MTAGVRCLVSESSRFLRGSSRFLRGSKALTTRRLHYRRGVTAQMRPLVRALESLAP